jgi:hypothetical protein
MKGPTRKRPHEAGVDLGGDLDRNQKYSETGHGARPRLSLAYVRPAWRDLIWIPNPPHKRKPKVSWRGNVARVRIKPVGFRLVEVEPDTWRLMMWRGAKSWPCTEPGPRELVEQALVWLLTEDRRPVYPPLSLVDRDHRAAVYGGARHG